MIPRSCKSNERRSCDWTNPNRDPLQFPASVPEELGTLTPKIKSRNIIQHDMAHGLNIFLGRIRDDGGPLSKGSFLLLTGDLSRVRPKHILLPTRKLEVKQNYRNLTH